MTVSEPPDTQSEDFCGFFVCIVLGLGVWFCGGFCTLCLRNSDASSNILTLELFSLADYQVI